MDSSEHTAMSKPRNFIPNSQVFSHSWPDFLDDSGIIAAN